MNNNKLLIVAAAILSVFLGAVAFNKLHVPDKLPQPQLESQFKLIPEKTEPIKLAEKPNISVITPTYLDYPDIIKQLNKWHNEAPELTEIGTYGKSTHSNDLYYIRLNNKLTKGNKPVVLLTACIHGNESWATGLMMAHFGNLLNSYRSTPELTDLIDTRDIYFIPVVSPDSYPFSRFVDGVDPNRNFPNPHKQQNQVKPVKALMDFFVKINPKATISCHTWGRACLIPWGDSLTNCPDYNEYQRVVGTMCSLMNYKFMRTCDMYGKHGLNVPPPRDLLVGNNGTPIYGTEVDWYYRNGSMAIVMEIGTHQRKPTYEEIKSEFERTYKGILFFIKEAPETNLSIKR